MKKLNKKNLGVSFAIILSLSILGFLAFNASQNSEKDEPKAISTITKMNLEDLVKKEKSFFVIFGESKAPSTKKLIDATLDRIEEINKDVYFFDTSVYIDNLFDTELKQDEKNKIIAQYTTFLNTYEIKTSPTIVSFKKNDKTSLGKYIPDAYYETSKAKQQKVLLEKANEKLLEWILAND